MCTSCNALHWHNKQFAVNCCKQMGYINKLLNYVMKSADRRKRGRLMYIFFSFRVKRSLGKWMSLSLKSPRLCCIVKPIVPCQSVFRMQLLLPNYMPAIYLNSSTERHFTVCKHSVSLLHHMIKGAAVLSLPISWY